MIHLDTKAALAYELAWQSGSNRGCGAARALRSARRLRQRAMCIPEGWPGHCARLRFVSNKCVAWTTASVLYVPPPSRAIVVVAASAGRNIQELARKLAGIVAKHGDHLVNGTMRFDCLHTVRILIGDKVL